MQSFWGNGGLVVAHIDARLVVERLNAVVGDRWSEKHRSLGDGLMVCELTVNGQTHEDVGKGSGPEAAKAMYSDSLKRAAVKFGVGVSIYAMKVVQLNVGQEPNNLRRRSRRRRGKRPTR